MKAGFGFKIFTYYPEAVAASKSEWGVKMGRPFRTMVFAVVTLQLTCLPCSLP